MKQIIFILISVIGLSLQLFSQENSDESENTKYIQINTELKPYIEGGYFLTPDIVLTGGIGFYRNGDIEKTYFMIGGGISKFFKTTGHLNFYSGGSFNYEANPDAVNRSPYESVVTISAHSGGWVNLSKQIHLDGKIGLNLNFNGQGRGSDNSVNFGFMTYSVGIVFTF